MKQVFLLTVFVIVLMALQLLTTIPVVLVAFLVFFISNKHAIVFILSCVAGILLDVFFIRPLGITSLFMQACFLLILLYERKFEIKTVPFILVFTAIASFAFLTITGSSSVVKETIVASMLSVGFFLFIYKRNAEINSV